MDLPPLWVISLERAHDRRAFVREAFREAGLDPIILDAVDAKTLTPTELRAYSAMRTMYHYGKPLWKGMFACAASHLAAWERMVLEDLPEVVIFEDDVRPLPDFEQVVRARDVVPEDRDVVTLHSLFEWATPIPIDDRVIADKYRVCRYQRTPMGAQAYVLSRSGARRLVDVARPICMPPDELLLRRHPAGLRVYGIEPTVVSHEEFGSVQRGLPQPVVEPRWIELPLLATARLTGKVARRVRPSP